MAVNRTPPTPRKTVVGLINNLKDKVDPLLWQVLRDLGELENDTFNSLLKLQQSNIWNLRIPNIQLSAANDIAGYWPRVYIPRDDSGNMLFSNIYLHTIGVSLETGASGADFVADVQVSKDNGVNFASIFKTTTTLIVPDGFQTITNGTNVIANLGDQDLIRFDCSATGGATTAELYLEGSFQ